MRIPALTSLCILVACSGLPAEHHPVADFALACDGVGSGDVKSAVAVFARQSGQSLEVRRASETELNMVLNGDPGLGHHILVDWLAKGRTSGATPCASAHRPCLVVTALSGGPLSDEMSEASTSQRRTAMDLRRRLEGVCSSK